MDMGKLHDVKNLMHTFYIAYLDAFVPEGERPLLFCFFSTECLIILKKPLMAKKVWILYIPFRLTAHTAKENWRKVKTGNFKEVTVAIIILQR